MTYTEMATLATTDSFRTRVRCSSLSYAQVVLGENPSTHNRLDEKRNALAAATLSDGGAAMLDRFAWGLATRPGFSGTPTDADIDFAIQTGWNDFALVTAAEAAN